VRRGIAFQVDGLPGREVLGLAMPVDLRQLPVVEIGKKRDFAANGHAHVQRAGRRVRVWHGQGDLAAFVYGLFHRAVE